MMSVAPALFTRFRNQFPETDGANLAAVVESSKCRVPNSAGIAVFG